MIESRMRSLNLLVSLIAGAVAGGPLVGHAIAGEVRTQIEVRLPSNPGGHESMIVDYNELKSDFAAVTLKTHGKLHRDTGFYCQKKARLTSCVGDDDSGRFTISKDGIRIEFLNLNVGGEQVLRYRGPARSLKFSRKS